MGVLVKSGEYALAKLVNQFKEKTNRLIEISEAESIELGLIEYHGEPEIEPTGEPEPEAQHDYSKDYLTFEAIEDCKFSINNTFYYSINNGNTWNALQENEETPLITAGNKILWKCQNPIMLTNSSGAKLGIGTYNSTGKFNISGNIMSLINSDNFNNTKDIGEDQFKKLFMNNNVINAKNLILPSTTLTKLCYASMFRNCILLLTAPKLQATTLVDCCYDTMFKGCTSLNYIKCLAINLKDSSPQSVYNTGLWVEGVNKSGTFIKHKDANWNIGDSGIPNNWLIEEVEE